MNDVIKTAKDFLLSSWDQILRVALAGGVPAAVGHVVDSNTSLTYLAAAGVLGLVVGGVKISLRK